MPASHSAIGGLSSTLWLKPQDPKITLCGNTPLCRRCISIFQRPSALQKAANQLITNNNLQLHFMIRDFWEAAERGSFICQLLRTCHPQASWDKFLEVRGKQWRHLTLNPFNMRLEFAKKSEERPRTRELGFQIGYLLTPKRARFSLVSHMEKQRIAGLTGEISTFSGSESSLNLAKHWYYDCLLDHDSCGPFTTAFKGNTWLPTRLIYITESEAKTCYGNALPEADLPYATLSHCWGKTPIFTMKSTNITQLEVALPMSQLPHTFQDAIQVCRELQIRYLWIDSLCIMQDSNEDWTFEAKRMGLVYKHCCLNIAATGFPDGLKRFFVHRNTSLLQPMEVQSEGSQFVAKGRYHLIWDETWNEQILSAPLNTRAWVFQERVLSPRILHFGTRQLLWECKEKEACESYPRSMPDTGGGLRSQISQQRKFKKDNPIDGLELIWNRKRSTDESLEMIWQFWAAIVETYSGTQLTKEEDKLIALSGVIQEMEQILHSECLAGIRRRDLPLQLLWSVPKAECCAVTRPINSQAPSWSWASLDSRVNPWVNPDPKSLSKGSRLVSKLLSASIKTDDTKSPPCFQRGELHFKGPLMEAAFEHADYNWSGRLRSRIPQMEIENYLWGVPRLRIYVRGSKRDFISARVKLDPHDIREWNKKWYTYIAETSDDGGKDQFRMDIAQWSKLMKDDNDELPHIFLFPLVADPRPSRYADEPDDNEDEDFYGLILSTTGTEEGVFCRLGTFETVRYNKKSDLCFNHVLLEELDLKIENYQACEGRNEYIITVI